MIIQNSTPPSQAALPARRVSDDAPKLVAETPSSRAAPVVADQSPKTEHAKTTVKQAGAPQQSPAEQLKSAVNDINKAMRQSNQSLEFSVDNDTKKPMVKLVDSDTGELIRQIPSEETLAIARSIDRFQRGLLLKQQA